MPKNLRWKIPLIVVLIAIAIMALYPVANKPIKSENITEINGKVIDRTIIDDTFFSFLFKSPIKMNVTSAMIISISLSLLIEGVRKRDFKNTILDLKIIFSVFSGPI